MSVTDAIGSTEGFTFELRPAKTSVPQTKLAGGMAQPFGGSVMFDNRTQAGRLLVEPLVQMKLRRPLVLALPRGGVP